LTDEKGKILRFLRLDKLFENLTGYIETQIALVKLDLKEQAQKSVEGFFQVLLLLSLAGFTILFISIGVSIILNNIFNSNYLGYLLIALAYLILFIFILLDKNNSFSKWLTSLIFKNLD